MTYKIITKTKTPRFYDFITNYLERAGSTYVIRHGQDYFDSRIDILCLDAVQKFNRLYSENVIFLRQGDELVFKDSGVL